MSSTCFQGKTSRKMLDDLRQEIKSVPQAFAELVDNTRDVGCQLGRQLSIHINVNHTPQSNYGPFEFHVEDNGPGISQEEALHAMFGFGFSGKAKGQIGQYGLGVKHAGMRLAHHVLAFIKAEEVAYIVLMSPQYLKEKGIEDVQYPFVRLSKQEGKFMLDSSQNAVSELVANSNFENKEALLSVFESMYETGIKYVIYNFRHNQEFDVTTDEKDIRVMTCGDEGDKKSELFTLPREMQPATAKVPEDWSLRDYMQILYAGESKVNIVLRGEPIMPRDPKDMLDKDMQRFKLIIRTKADEDTTAFATDVIQVPESTYEARENDRLADIATQFKMDKWALVRANLAIDPNLNTCTRLTAGTRVVIPARSIAVFEADLWLGFADGETQKRLTRGTTNSSIRHGGIHMYTRGRNCRLYSRFAAQRSARGGYLVCQVLGVLHADFVTMNRSKTDYTENDVKYGLLSKAVSEAITKYYQRIQTVHTGGVQNKNNKVPLRDESYVIRVGVSDPRMSNEDYSLEEAQWEGVAMDAAEAVPRQRVPRPARERVPAQGGGSGQGRAGRPRRPNARKQKRRKNEEREGDEDTSEEEFQEELLRQMMEDEGDEGRGPIGRGMDRMNQTLEEARKLAPGEFRHYDPGYGETFTQCVCQLNVGGFMIECDHCSKWSHGMCTGYFNAAEAPAVFNCAHCIQASEDPSEMEAEIFPKPRHRLQNAGVRMLIVQVVLVAEEIIWQRDENSEWLITWEEQIQQSGTVYDVVMCVLKLEDYLRRHGLIRSWPENENTHNGGTGTNYGSQQMDTKPTGLGSRDEWIDELTNLGKILRTHLNAPNEFGIGSVVGSHKLQPEVRQMWRVLSRMFGLGEDVGGILAEDNPFICPDSATVVKTESADHGVTFQGFASDEAKPSISRGCQDNDPTSGVFPSEDVKPNLLDLDECKPDIKPDLFDLNESKPEVKLFTHPNLDRVFFDLTCGTEDRGETSQGMQVDELPVTNPEVTNPEETGVPAMEGSNGGIKRKVLYDWLAGTVDCPPMSRVKRESEHSLVMGPDTAAVENEAQDEAPENEAQDQLTERMHTSPSVSIDDLEKLNEEPNTGEELACCSGEREDVMKWLESHSLGQWFNVLCGKVVGVERMDDLKHLEWQGVQAGGMTWVGWKRLDAALALRNAQ